MCYSILQKMGLKFLYVLQPKIKFYIEVKGELKSREDYDKVNELANQKIEAVKVSLGI